MIEAKDYRLECTKCGQPFTFTAAEAKQFLEKGLTNIPKKCPACRAKDRVKKEQKTRVPVTCSECGASFDVPFEPSRDDDGKLRRPLYCVEHFESRQPAA